MDSNTKIQRIFEPELPNSKARASTVNYNYNELDISYIISIYLHFWSLRHSFGMASEFTVYEIKKNRSNKMKSGDNAYNNLENKFYYTIANNRLIIIFQ